MANIVSRKENAKMLRITIESSDIDRAIVTVIGVLFLGMTFWLSVILLSQYIGDFWAFTLILSYSYALIFMIRVLGNFTK